jgi:hypothetical protein
MDTSATWDSALLELERMALAASSSDALESESFPTDVQMARWQKLFGYTRREAFDLIKAHRADLTRTRISDEHWELVREEQEGRGGDRETYEVCSMFSLHRGPRCARGIGRLGLGARRKYLGGEKREICWDGS